MERDLDLFGPSVSSLYRYGMEAYTASRIWGKDCTYGSSICYSEGVSALVVDHG